MRLSELLAGLPVAWGDRRDPEVSAIAHDSRSLPPGALFVAWKGERYDGAAFALEAERRGAVAVIGEGDPPPGLLLPWIAAADPRLLLGKVSARLTEHPDRRMTVVGVTGTNGKSTVVALVAAILEAAGRPCGCLGTLGYRFREHDLGFGRTTPEASELFAALREVRRRGGVAVAMEVSSHALAQKRVEEVRFDVAAFTNLSRDHLDFHRDEGSYMEAKRRLFGLCKDGGRAVVCTDDRWGRELAEELGSATITVGAEGRVRAAESVLSATGIRARVSSPGGELLLQSPLLGGFNLANLLVAVGIAEALEIPEAAIEEGIRRRTPLPGRMERVDGGDAPPVVVDFAHTPAALEAALRGMREIGVEDLIVVFGCGGDRDPGKRIPMGRIAGELADLAIATSDNPRREDPLAILEAVAEGLRQSRNPRCQVVADRRRAIALAIAAAGPHSAVLIAGKGHEEEQIIGDERRPFSDRVEARRVLERRSVAAP